MLVETYHTFGSWSISWFSSKTKKVKKSWRGTRVYYGMSLTLFSEWLIRVINKNFIGETLHNASGWMESLKNSHKDMSHGKINVISFYCKPRNCRIDGDSLFRQYFVAFCRIFRKVSKIWIKESVIDHKKPFKQTRVSVINRSNIEIHKKISYKSFFCKLLLSSIHRLLYLK